MVEKQSDESLQAPGEMGYGTLSMSTEFMVITQTI